MSEQEQSDQGQRLTTADIAGTAVPTQARADEPAGVGTLDLVSPESPSRPATRSEGEGGLADRSADAPLLPDNEASRFSSDWQTVQGNFVDRPREAVEQADRLVADLMQRLAAQFSETRANLEQQWDGQAEISTEELRLAMMRYRSFFQRLLSA